MPSIRSFIFLAPFLAFTAFAQNYPSTYVEWPVPDGGAVVGGVVCGYNTVSAPTGTIQTGDQRWIVRDMDGDDHADLVVMAERLAAGYYATFDPGPTTHWRVHINNGAGFDATPVQWALPPGGNLQAGNAGGFYTEYSGGGGDEGSNAWFLDDLDGDGRPDLVVCGVVGPDGVTAFSPNNNSYWNVHLNTGSGFALTPTTWSLPDGGAITLGVERGFHYMQNPSPTAGDLGTDAWYLFDLDNDGRRELVVCGEMVLFGGGWDHPAAFDMGGDSYWKLYHNTGTGYALTHTEWSLPDGGFIYNGDDVGFYNGYSHNVNGSVGAESWNLRDLNGDGVLDLVVYAAENAAGDIKGFDVGPDSYWKVFMSGTSGFSDTPITWSLPDGGHIADGTELGFNNVQSTVFAEQGAELWYTLAMNDDHRDDLLMSGIWATDELITEFDPLGASHWRMFVNNGSGFEEAFTTWSLPEGGALSDGEVHGYAQMTSGTSTSSNVDDGSEAWSAVDLDNSGTPDLVVTSARGSGTQFLTFGASGAQYWKVYWNPFWVGMDEVSTGPSALQLSPNPTNGMLNVGLASGTVREVVLRDARGQEVMRSRGARLDLTSLDAGLYLLVATDTDGLRHPARVVKE